MSKIFVTPTEENRLYIHPDTGQEFPSGQVVETEPDWFVNAKINMGHLQKVETEANAPGDLSSLSLESFAALKADEQKKELVRLALAASEKDEAISSEEKRLALYQQHLGEQ